MMKIKELVSKLKEHSGGTTVKIWSKGADKAYPISYLFIGSINEEDFVYINIDDRNLVDLSKIWHDASEEPKDKNERILCYSDYFDYFFTESPNYLMVKDGGQNKDWETVVLRNKISKWAYTEDLLPKGGEK